LRDAFRAEAGDAARATTPLRQQRRPRGSECLQPRAEGHHSGGGVALRQLELADLPPAECFLLPRAVIAEDDHGLPEGIRRPSHAPESGECLTLDEQDPRGLEVILSYLRQRAVAERDRLVGPPLQERDAGPLG